MGGWCGVGQFLWAQLLIVSPPAPTIRPLLPSLLVTHLLVTHFLVTEFLFVLDSLNLSVKEKIVTEKKIPCIFSPLIVVPKFVVTKVIVTEMSYNPQNITDNLCLLLDAVMICHLMQKNSNEKWY